MNHPQSWQNCDQDIKYYIEKLVELAKANLANLTGVYLHGSLAMGSYYRPKSDIDLIIVVDGIVNPSVRKSFSIIVAEFSQKRPTIGNIELSVITESTAKMAPSPPPYEIHFSNDWHDRIMSEEVNFTKTSTDIDLLSHLLYVKQRGLCLYGKPIEKVFGEIAWEDYMHAVMDDFKWIIDDQHILETPYYSVLNICRTLQLTREDRHLVHSKDEGGEWGLLNIPDEHHSVIQKSLEVYRSDAVIPEVDRRTGGVIWDQNELLAIRDYARSSLSK